MYLKHIKRIEENLYKKYIYNYYFLSLNLFRLVYFVITLKKQK